jgi:hypothetical protein
MKYEDVEMEKFLLEDFIRARVNMLNDKVVRALNVPGLAVKMFQPQINGGLKEVCEFTFEGIPFGRLNSSRRAKVGLSLIKEMSKFYGVELPVFLDNSESINEVGDYGFQLIELKVTEDKILKVEVKK